MKPAFTQLPPAPKKGDIPACKLYASYQARYSNNPTRTLASIWITFIKYSYLQDNAPRRQRHLAGLKEVRR